MIKIAELTEADKGRWVEYSSRLPNSEQNGRIKGWNDMWVFVVYGCDDNWDRYGDYTGCITDPKDLRFIVDPTQQS